MSFKTYQSKRARYAIHRPVEYINVIGPTSQPGMRIVPRPPIEFKNHRFTARNEEEEEFLDNHLRNGKGPRDDFFAVESIPKVSTEEETPEEDEEEEIELTPVEDVTSKNDVIQFFAKEDIPIEEAQDKNGHFNAMKAEAAVRKRGFDFPNYGQ